MLIFLTRGEVLPETGQIKFSVVLCATMKLLFVVLNWLVKVFLKKPVIAVFYRIDNEKESKTSSVTKAVT